MVWCQAVSMMATWGMPGRTSMAASMPRTLGGLWRGARL